MTIPRSLIVNPSDPGWYLKRRHDPHECFTSDWYRHHREMFADVL